MHTHQQDKSSLCQHHGVLFITPQKRKEHRIFKRSPFITWKHLQNKQKTEANLLCYLNIPTGLMDRQEEHQGEWGEIKKKIRALLLV